jgi:3-hydroxymyristoyl/3-hydroxydecanoyl-(acyl carrier protein) dehydratase
MTEPFRLLDVEPTDGGLTARVEVPAASPLFAGHFPGSPILPGIAQLAMLEAALAGSALREIRILRFRNLVLPGDALELRAALPGADGAVRFDLRRGGEPVSDGTAVFGPFHPSAEPTPASAEPSPASAEPSPASAEPSPASAEPSPASAEPSPPGPLSRAETSPPAPLSLPHAPPARFVRAIEAAGEGELACLAAIPGSHPLAAGGFVPAFLALEAAAQAAAALEALARPDFSSGPRIGYLVGIRDARLGLARLPADRELRVIVRLEGNVPPLARYRAEIFLAAAPGGEEPAVAGSVSTYATDRPVG